MQPIDEFMRGIYGIVRKHDGAPGGQVLDRLHDCFYAEFRTIPRETLAGLFTTFAGLWQQDEETVEPARDSSPAVL